MEQVQLAVTEPRLPGVDDAEKSARGRVREEVPRVAIVVNEDGRVALQRFEQVRNQRNCPQNAAPQVCIDTVGGLRQAASTSMSAV